jgi:hypothetical protein
LAVRSPLGLEFEFGFEGEGPEDAGRLRMDDIMSLRCCVLSSRSLSLTITETR